MVPKYEFIHNLAQDDWQIITRGRRLADHQPVLLKTLRREIHASDASKLLEQEFEMRRRINLPGVPRALELLRSENGKSDCLVTEDPGGAPLFETFPAGRIDLEVFFNFAIHLTKILDELHRQDLIHRNISPHILLFDSSTGDVWVADLSLSIRSAGEIQTPLPAYLLPDLLAYSSPEQTGRMNRAVDYRTDFYSLGVTFYQLLTGRLPFESTDALELIHCHIAKTPPAPAELNPKIPEPLSQIVMKLLAKTAEERYQSALGLQSDLEICRREWAAQRSIDPFLLGRQDVSDRFLIPHKLYGREEAVAELAAAFEQICVADSYAAMMLVNGYSGIGKTSLIQELYRPIARQRGYFISGKFDQVARGVPFGALIQAFRALVRQLLTESDEQLGLWRLRLTEALRGQGGALAEVIPEIELIVGKQPPLPVVGATEALNRFQLVFQNFVGALARPEHPLVVFLDDLQWADSATLSLLGPLLTTSSIKSLFIMGAYRDNEVDETHPLTRTIRSLEAAGGIVRRVPLGPLKRADVTRFVAETLRCEDANAWPLADLVLGKTGGNPFFVIQFLKTLQQEGLLKFDYQQRCWTYRLDQIAGAGITDNVIDLMTKKIQRLPAKTQRILTLASCIGASFDQQTLAIVSEQTLEAAADDLKVAIDEGLILLIADRGLRLAEEDLNPDSIHPIKDNPQSAIRHPQSYAFLHDRVQQAAYALIPEEKKQSVHLAVGRLLLEREDLESTEKQLFDVVYHLNRGRGLMTEKAERLSLARLNLRAGQRAKSSTAHEAALEYLNAGISLLNEGAWESEYDLAFALHLEAAECRRLSGGFVEAEREYELLLPRAKTKLDQARVHNLRILQFENQSRYAEALAAARQCLALFGVSFPDASPEQQLALEREVAAIQTLLNGRRISGLIDLPVMTDPEIKMVMNILVTTWSSAYITGEQILTRLLSATIVRLSLEHGNSEESAYGYATHAITIGPVRGDYETAYEFGVLALGVNERFNDPRLRAKVCQQFQAHVALWRRPLQICLTYAQEARRSGFESGDFTYGIYGAFTETWSAIAITQDLRQYVRQFTPDLALFKKLKVAAVGDGLKIMLNWPRALMGETRAPLSLSDDEFDEEKYAETYRGNPFYTMFYAAAKLHLSYLLGEYKTALELARLTREVVPNLSGTIWTVICDFWSGLTLAANYADASAAERPNYLEEMRQAKNNLTVLAENCPENYLCQSLLLSAEIERVLEHEPEATELYERAIRDAEDRQAIQYRALAHELYARFQLNWPGRAATAAVLLDEARRCYAQWGATAKVEELGRRYENIFGRASHPLSENAHTDGPDLTRTLRRETGSLDLFSVMKASQAIAGEIEMGRLLAKLIRIAIENAGAGRGYLLLERNGELFIYAEDSLEAAEAKLYNGVPVRETESLPLSIVNYVCRVREGVVLAEATNDETYGDDPYIVKHRPRSIMCAPVMEKGDVKGVLYLENNLVGGAFTDDRIRVCQILASQAAISLENARLYSDTMQAGEMLRSITEGTAGVIGDDFFPSLVRHLASALQVRYAFVTECRTQKELGPKARARMLAFWMGDRLAGEVTYEIAETPCLKVLEGETCFYPFGVQQLFPNDHDLVDLSAVGYLGIPLYGASGEVIGHLAILDDKPMVKTPQNLSLLRIFAARAGAELERLRMESELRFANEELERLKNQYQADAIYLQEEIHHEHNFEEIVGASPALLSFLQQVDRVAPTDATVLILGETGTGKELIARALHSRSIRKNRPLVKINCGSIPTALVESELFGHLKGAFTGALEKRVGRFELADGGTLFLDEVGELPLETQVKLLRVLQEGEFEPVGSNKTIKVDVRIIAATNRNLEEEVKAGRFRVDLYYRLNVLPLHNPPLRERRSDIPQLAMFFLSRFSRRFGRQVDRIAPDTMQLLKNYDWPGNIRELQNLIERGVILSAGSTLTIDPRLLSTRLINHEELAKLDQITLTASATTIAAPPSTQESQVPKPPSSTPSLDDLQRQHILNVLTQTNWVIEGEKGAAKMLDLHPNTLRSRLKKMGIQRPKS